MSHLGWRGSTWAKISVCAPLLIGLKGGVREKRERARK